MLFAKKIELYFFEIIQFYFWKQMVYLVYEFLQKKGENSYGNRKRGTSSYRKRDG